jgi:hypothetical protein
VIEVVPLAMPVTIPVPVPTDAIAGLALLHAPPPASLSALTEPAQTLVEPLMGPGAEFTLTDVVAIHPVGNRYVIIAVPGPEPVTKPVPAPTVAMDVLLLLHVPPPAASLSVVPRPEHIEVIPVTGASGLTAMLLVTKHPTPEE